LTRLRTTLMLECDGSGRRMFQRFTDKARRTVVLAQEEARALQHDHIGTEHLLLGLLRESAGVAASALISLGVSLAAARERVAGAGGLPEQRASGPSSGGHIPFTPTAKRVLELALRESLQLGHDYIGTEHILLGLVRDQGCRAAVILSELGADQAAITQRVLELRPASLRRPAGTEPQNLTEVRVKVESVLSRLAAIERFIGLVPDLAEFDTELGRLRREKDEAIDAQDFRLAEALSDAETDLLVDRDRLAAEWQQRPSLAAQVARLRGEVERLRTVLRAHGLDADEAAGNADPT
jgi:Clp amino terminal domain, pathogenicity island component